ncbi:MAG: helix-turn-helix domain-containing protein [Hyphomicrobiales bacterium]
MSLASIFGSNLRIQRKALGITQAKLAERLDMSTEMISKLERGVASPSFPTVKRIADNIGVPEVLFFTIGTQTVPTGDYARLLTRVQSSLSRMNEDQLARAEKVLAALVD